MVNKKSSRRKKLLAAAGGGVVGGLGIAAGLLIRNPKFRAAFKESRLGYAGPMKGVNRKLGALLGKGVYIPTKFIKNLKAKRRQAETMKDITTALAGRKVIGKGLNKLPWE